jgi:beta-N-acetylhexosaminidase
VLDIHTNPKNPVIGDRALAENADLVARLGAAIVRGLQDGGVAACGKHFPARRYVGRFASRLPLEEHPPDRIRRVECVPFSGGDSRRRGVHHDRALSSCRRWTRSGRPRLSPRVVRRCLRDELDFSG